MLCLWTLEYGPANPNYNSFKPGRRQWNEIKGFMWFHVSCEILLMRPAKKEQVSRHI